MKFSHTAATFAAMLSFASVTKADFYANFFDGELIRLAFASCHYSVHDGSRRQ
jgi:hypothetical protein